MCKGYLRALNIVLPDCMDLYARTNLNTDACTNLHHLDCTRVHQLGCTRQGAPGGGGRLIGRLDVLKPLVICSVRSGSQFRCQWLHPTAPCKCACPTRCTIKPTRSPGPGAQWTTLQPVQTVEKRTEMIVLPYLGKLSLEIRNRLRKYVNKHVSNCKLLVIFRSQRRLSTMFRFKDVMPSDLQSYILYRYKCGTCNSSYIGKTDRHCHIRWCEHLKIQPFRGRP